MVFISEASVCTGEKGEWLVLRALPRLQSYPLRQCKHWKLGATLQPSAILALMPP